MNPAQQAIDSGLADRLRWLLAEPVTRLEPLPGGHSGISVQGATTSGRRLAVRIAAAGRPAVGRHDVLRQARIMSALDGLVPVPRVLATDAAAPPLVVMEFVDGEAYEPAVDPSRPASRPSIGRRFSVGAELLARLHRAIDTCPDGESLLDVEAQLELAARIAGAGEETFRAAAAVAAEALRHGRPADVSPVLVHGDFRLGNILFDGIRPAAILDWEIWSWGDPRVDLGWFLTFTDADNFPGLAGPDLALPAQHLLVEIYEQHLGARFPDVDWFVRLGAFRMASIMSHNLARHRSGKHHDPFQDTLPPTIARLLERARAG